MSNNPTSPTRSKRPRSPRSPTSKLPFIVVPPLPRSHRVVLLSSSLPAPQLPAPPLPAPPLPAPPLSAPPRTSSRSSRSPSSSPSRSSRSRDSSPDTSPDTRSARGKLTMSGYTQITSPSFRVPPFGSFQPTPRVLGTPRAGLLRRKMTNKLAPKKGKESRPRPRRRRTRRRVL